MSHRQPQLPSSPFMDGDRVVGVRPSNIYHRKVGTVDKTFWLDSTGWHVNVVFDDGSETLKFTSHQVFDFAENAATA